MAVFIWVVEFGLYETERALADTLVVLAVLL